jgi:hypothetical protein
MCYVGGDYKNDIFFSYAHGNDDLRRWSLSLSNRIRNSIETLLQVRPGGVAFWTDADLEGNKQLTSNIKTNVQLSAVIVIVMSELYINSQWCQDEAAWFGEMMRERGYKDGRVFLVNALRVEGKQWPAFFADERGDRLPGYDFFDVKKPLSLPYGWYNFEDADFGSAIVRLAEQLASHLMKFRDQVRAARPQPSASASPAETGPSQSPGTGELSGTPRLLLGLAPEDLDEEREALAQSLQAASFEVVAPERPFNVNEIRPVVENAAQGCAGLVQLCGRAPGVWSYDSNGYVLHQLKLFDRRRWLVKADGLDIAKLRPSAYADFLRVNAAELDQRFDPTRVHDEIAARNSPADDEVTRTIFIQSRREYAKIEELVRQRLLRLNVVEPILFPTPPIWQTAEPQQIDAVLDRGWGLAEKCDCVLMLFNRYGSALSEDLLDYVRWFLAGRQSRPPAAIVDATTEGSGPTPPARGIPVFKLGAQSFDVDVKNWLLDPNI